VKKYERGVKPALDDGLRAEVVLGEFDWEWGVIGACICMYLIYASGKKLMIFMVVGFR
jgi:hypothetical protein